MHLVLLGCWVVVILMIGGSYCSRGRSLSYVLMILAGLSAFILWHAHPIASAPSDPADHYLFVLFVYLLPLIAIVFGAEMLLIRYITIRRRK